MKLSTLVLAFVLLLPAALGGCTNRAYVRHAQMGFALYGLNERIVPVVNNVCRDTALAAARNPDVTTEQATLAAARVMENCEDVSQLQHRFAEQHRVWMAVVAMVDEDSQPDMSQSSRILHGLADIYVEIASLLRERFDTAIPNLPAVVLRFLE